MPGHCCLSYSSTRHLVGHPRRSYNGVSQLPNVSSHRTVNHSVEFVDSVTGVHTQNIESYWNRVKMKLKRMKGCRAEEIPMSLCGGSALDSSTLFNPYLLSPPHLLQIIFYRFFSKPPKNKSFTFAKRRQRCQ